MNEIILTEENFEQEVVKSNKPVLVDFWATWCGPCQMLSPVIKKIAEEHSEIKVCKCNVDEQPFLAQKFGILGIPFVAVFKNGVMEKSSVGYRPEEDILNLLR